MELSNLGIRQNSLKFGKIVTMPSMAFKDWLGLSPAIVKTLRSDFDYIRLGRDGIRRSEIDHLGSMMGVSRKVLAEDIFDVSVKTIERKNSTARIDPRISSQAIEIAKVLQHGYEVFGDKDKLIAWIHRENRALNGQPPIQLFSTLTGLSLVNDILGRIQEGVYT